MTWKTAVRGVKYGPSIYADTPCDMDSGRLLSKQQGYQHLVLQLSYFTALESMTSRDVRGSSREPLPNLHVYHLRLMMFDSGCNCCASARLYEATRTCKDAE